jgi:YHS domain-containing protein
MNRIQQVDPTQISSEAKHRFNPKCKTLTNLIMKPGLIVFALGALIAHNSSATVTNFPPDRPVGDLKISHPVMRVWAEKGVHKVNVDSNGVILKGYDPVAYFTQKKAVKGSSKYQSTYQGATYYFSSAARNRAELEICYSLFFESYYFACKFVREKAVQAMRPELPDSKIAEQSGRVDWAGGDLQAAGCRNNRKASA